MKSYVRVVLKQGRARPLWSGHPWVYAGAVHAVVGSPSAGELVCVSDAEGQVIGWGHYGGHGAIAVRMISLSADMPNELALIRRRIDEAIQRRAALGLPNAQTDAFRLIFAEGDRLPGLVVDQLGDGLVVDLSTAAMVRLRGPIVDTLMNSVGPAWLVVSTPAEAAKLEGLPAFEELVRGHADQVAEATVHEHGLKYAVDPLGGQKTGFYADQRENRRRVAELARGRKVLDAYCYGGAYALTALSLGEASHAVAVDSSARACRLAERNAALQHASLQVVCEDATVYLREHAPSEKFDMVVVDPPKFARSRQGLPDSLKKYRKVNELAMRALPPGGMLVTHSCSGLVEPADFLRMLGEAAFQAGSVFHVLEYRGQAGCHPWLVSAPETHYLKCVIGEVRPR